MDNLAKFKKPRGNRKYTDSFPKGILDVIETDYPDKYNAFLETQIQINTLFSSEEWLDILIKSRNSYKNRIKSIGKARK